MQVAPDGLVARALMRSAPAPAGSRRRISNDLLGPRAALTVLTGRSEPDPLAQLSEREREVLALLVEGLRNS